MSTYTQPFPIQNHVHNVWLLESKIIYIFHMFIDSLLLLLVVGLFDGLCFFHFTALYGIFFSSESQK